LLSNRYFIFSVITYCCSNATIFMTCLDMLMLV